MLRRIRRRRQYARKANKYDFDAGLCGERSRLRAIIVQSSHLSLNKRYSPVCHKAFPDRNCRIGPAGGASTGLPSVFL
jgi:hypothetical protein